MQVVGAVSTEGGNIAPIMAIIPQDLPAEIPAKGMEVQAADPSPFAAVEQHAPAQTAPFVYRKSLIHPLLSSDELHKSKNSNMSSKAQEICKAGGADGRLHYCWHPQREYLEHVTWSGV